MLKVNSCNDCKTSETLIKKYTTTYLCTICYQKEKESQIATDLRKTFIYPEIDKITEKIYLGNSDAAMDKNKLKELGITDILITGTFLSPMFPDDFNYHIIEIEDTDEEDISAHFLEAFEFMEKANKLFVHCFAGMSRSPSFVIAYLMYKTKKDYSKVYSYVKTKRKVINPNNGFKRILLKFDKFLKQYEYNIKDFIISKGIKLSSEVLDLI
jgi:protein-tyrosine phosphatase